jgi:hypothetical protein
MIRLKTLLVIVVLSISHNAFADSIIVFDGNRAVVANALGKTMFAVGDWSDSFLTTSGADRNIQGFASQTSTLSSAFLGGEGFAETRLLSGPTGPDNFAQSRLQASFTITENYLGQLNIDLFESAGSAGNSTSVRLRQLGPFGNEIWDLSGTTGMSTLAREVVLGPGTYMFFTQAFATMAPSALGAASFNGGLSLSPTTRLPDPITPVPEPASLTLVALGLFSAGARKWRSNQHR